MKKYVQLCLSSISCCLYAYSFLDLNHLCQRIPRGVLEVVYGINIAPPQEGEDPSRAPYADELLSAYGCKFYLFLTRSTELVQCHTEPKGIVFGS